MNEKYERLIQAAKETGIAYLIESEARRIILASANPYAAKAGIKITEDFDARRTAQRERVITLTENDYKIIK